jgi:ABC-2 type transport system permease protein
MMRYFHFARIAFGDHMNNRVRQITRFIVYTLLVWVMVSMWRVIYATGHGAPGISLTDMSWYNGLAQMMFFLSPRLFTIIDDDVRTGNIAYFLTRPVPYVWMRFAEGAGALAGMLLLYFTAGTAFLYLFIGGWPDTGAASVIAGLVGLTIASLLHLLFQVCCGLSAFWTQDAIFVYHVYHRLILVLGGTYIPLSLYPDFLSGDVLRFLPFSAMVNGPGGLIFSGNLLAEFLELIALQCFWLMAVALLAQTIYNACLKIVEVNGG